MMWFGHIRDNCSCQILSVNGACPSLVICAVPTPVKTTPRLSGLHSGSSQRLATKNWKTEANLAENGWVRSAPAQLWPGDGQDGALWIDRHDVYSWMRLRESIDWAMSRRILHIHWTDFVTNDVVRSHTGQLYCSDSSSGGEASRSRGWAGQEPLTLTLMYRGGTIYGRRGRIPPDFNAMGQCPSPLSDGVTGYSAAEIRWATNLSAGSTQCLQIILGLSDTKASAVFWFMVTYL